MPIILDLTVLQKLSILKLIIMKVLSLPVFCNTWTDVPQLNHPVCASSGQQIWPRAEPYCIYSKLMSILHQQKTFKIWQTKILFIRPKITWYVQNQVPLVILIFEMLHSKFRTSFAQNPENRSGKKERIQKTLYKKKLDCIFKMKNNSISPIDIQI